jgi:hypothetical protein
MKPFQKTELHCVVKGGELTAVHDVPFVEYAMVFVPAPPATK